MLTVSENSGVLYIFYCVIFVPYLNCLRVALPFIGLKLCNIDNQYHASYQSTRIEQDWMEEQNAHQICLRSVDEGLTDREF